MKTIITFKPIQDLKAKSEVIIYNGLIDQDCIKYFLSEVERLYNKETKFDIIKHLDGYNFNFLVYYPLPDRYEDLTLKGLYLLQDYINEFNLCYRNTIDGYKDIIKEEISKY